MIHINALNVNVYFFHFVQINCKNRLINNSLLENN